MEYECDGGAGSDCGGSSCHWRCSNTIWRGDCVTAFAAWGSLASTPDGGRIASDAGRSDPATTAGQCQLVFLAHGRCSCSATS